MQGLPRLLVTHAFPADLAPRIDAGYTLVRWNRTPDGFASAAWSATVAGAEAILCTPADRLDAAMIEALPPSVRVVGTYSVGYEHIDLAACAARNIAVVNTPGVLSAATAEFTMLLILAAARRAGEGERMLRAGKWAGWSPAGIMGTQVSGKRLGIFGMGRIGQVLAGMARGFGMQLHYRNRRALPPDQAQGAHYHDTDAAFLAQCDVLAICAPASPHTLHWLDAGRIAQLPRGAVVVNTSRGSLVDDAALIAALQTGHIRAAGLDVFPHEPDVPAGYLTLENVVLTPHLGSATHETRLAMGRLVLDGIDAVLAGARPANLVEVV